MSELSPNTLVEQEQKESDIESMSEEEICILLDNISQSENKNNIPQEVSDRIIKRIYEIGDEDSLGISNNLLMKTFLAFSLDSAYDFSSDEETVTDRAYRAVIKFHHIDIDTGRQLESTFGQHRVVNPKVLVSIISELCADPKTGEYVISNIIDSLNYLLSFSDGKYDELLLNQLDFENSENFFRTTKLLDFFQELMNVSGMNSFSQHLRDKFINLLEKVIEENSGSYLLSIKVRKILSGFKLNNWSNFHFNRMNIKPFDYDSLQSSGLTITDEDFVDFQYVMNSDIRSYIEQEFNLDLDSLSDKEKFYFLKLIKQKNQKDLEKVKDFTNKFKSNGFKSFLSLDYGISMGDTVLQIGENLDQESAQKVFDKYAEFVDSLDKVEDVLNDAYGVKEHGSEVLKIKESILKKGKVLLEKFAESNEDDDVVSKIENIETESTLFFLVFKTLKESGHLPNLDDIKHISFEEKQSSEISSEDVQSMQEIYKGNYRGNAKLLENLLSKFESRLNDGITKFYVLKYQNKVKAFIGFTPQENGSVYFHSVNVNENLRGISIGNTMMEKALDKEAKENTLEADCAAYEKIGAKYIESGCVADSFYMYENNPSLHIVRDENKNKKYWGKQMKDSEIIDLFNNDDLPHNVTVVCAENQMGIKMDVITKTNVLTRYFNDIVSDKYYAVFERLV